MSSGRVRKDPGSGAAPRAAPRARAGAARRRAAPKRPVLIVLHQEHSTPGRVGRLIAERGHPLDVRRPRYGDPLPDTMDDHAGAVIFGGPMSANDADEYVRRETDWIGVPLREGRPFLGLCLGAQMLARHLGGEVSSRADGRAEIGYYPLLPTPAGEAFAAEIGAPWPTHVYHWHREGFAAPNGAETLATGDDFPTQAIRVGARAFGLQFHPEVTHAMLCRWTVRAAARLTAPGAQDRARQLEGRYLYDPNVARWIDAFLDAWFDEPDAAPARAGASSGPRSIRP